MIKERINSILIIRVFLLTNILAWYHFGYIVRLPSVINTLLQATNLSIISALLAGMGILFCFQKKKENMNGMKRKTIYYFLFLIATFFVLVIYTEIRYPSQGLFATIRVGANFLSVIEAPLYYIVFIHDGGIEKMVKYLNWICFVWYVLVLGQFLIYKMTGRIILDFATYFNNTPNIRLYGLRISVGIFGVLIILLNYILVYERERLARDRVFSIIQIILGMIVVIYVQQTRMITIVMFSCLVVCIFACRKSRKTRRIELIVVSLLLIVLGLSGYFRNLIQEMLYIDMKEGHVSYNNRLYSIKYYFDCFCNNVLLGNAFVADSKEYYSIVHGREGLAFYSDVGIVGLLGQVGLCSIVFFFAPILYLIKVIKKSRKIIEDRYLYNVLLVSLVYIIVTSFTLMITDAGRSQLFAFVIAIAMMAEKKCNDVIEKQN